MDFLALQADDALAQTGALKGTMSTTMHCALKQCLAAILLAE
jgi:hypothetical protein